MVKVTGNISFDVDGIEAGRIVAQVLMDDYKFITKDINELKAKIDPSDVELQDLENNINIRGAMAELLAYYLTYEEFVSFMESQRNYSYG